MIEKSKGMPTSSAVLQFMQENELYTHESKVEYSASYISQSPQSMSTNWQEVRVYISKKLN